MEEVHIVRRARAGDEQALTELCAHYHPVLCRFFSGLLRGQDGAEDLAQESLITMLRQLPSYRPLPGKRFEGWLMRLSYNKFLDRVRKKTTAPMPEGYDAPDPASGADLPLIEGERAQAVRRAMEALDDESRAMVTLRYELDMPYKDIAAALGTNPPRVKWRLNDALSKIKKQLLKEGFEWTN